MQLTNKAIAKQFGILAELMELHEDNPFKIKTYQNAYLQLRKLDAPVAELSVGELSKIKGIGKSSAEKIREIIQTGTMQVLADLQAQTPEGVQEMLQISGFGAKKIQTVWKELGIETLGELLYACNENRLLALKGFGAKTQADLQQKVQYFLQSRSKFHYATAEKVAEYLTKHLLARLPVGTRLGEVGALRRRCAVVERVELLAAVTAAEAEAALAGAATVRHRADNLLQGTVEGAGMDFCLHICMPAEFGSKQFLHTGTRAFLEGFVAMNPDLVFKDLPDEGMVFEKARMSPVPPTLRENADYLPQARARQLPPLVRSSQLKGVVHVHTTYSDGLHTLEAMATYARDLGYEYIGITDHSKSAFYANGLSAERVLEQMAAIDALNQRMSPFRIFKGIESDILSDGSLDYAPDLLAQFDFVIASVHSNLKMDELKATQRLLKAIENPYTTILGHPTGRLLLSREGYPLDHQRVIDACAANGVAIELNANPYRLDLDAAWIPYAMQKGVLIAINPDAHSQAAIADMRYGVFAARKGGLTTDCCLTAQTAEQFANFLVSRKK